MLTSWTTLDWETATVALAVVAAFVFLAVLWSNKEWRSRKIRFGIFFEREYRHPDDETKDEEITKEWPLRKDE